METYINKAALAHANDDLGAGVQDCSIYILYRCTTYSELSLYFSCCIYVTKLYKAEFETKFQSIIIELRHIKY